MSWEQQKENIQPIPQGRKICDLMNALTLVTDNKSRKDLIEERRKQFENECEQVKDDLEAQLNLWSHYIDWLEQNVPDGGKVNGLTNALEQCIELYYNRNEFKQDERLFDIFMKFKRFCDEPAEIFTFMYANSIGTLLARFYLNWSWQWEIKRNMKRAEDLIMLGLKNLATPRDVLEEALSQIKFRFVRMINSGELDDIPEDSSSAANSANLQAQLADGGIRAALQTLKFRVTKKQGLKVPVNRTGITAVDTVNVGGLKSQTRVVNGVRVPKKLTANGSKLRQKSNKPIEIFTTIRETTTDENTAASVTGTTDINAIRSTVVDENNCPTMNLIEKLPSMKQQMSLIARSGAENAAPVRGVLATKNKPPVLLD